jgi:hypothetical protein
MLGNVIEKSPSYPEHYFYDTSEDEEPQTKKAKTGSSSSQESTANKDSFKKEEV